MSGPYHRPHQWNWFTQRRAYKLFMIRELTSVFIALYTIVLLVFLYKLGQGEQPFVAFLGSLTHPGWMVLHAIAPAVGPVSEMSFGWSLDFILMLEARCEETEQSVLIHRNATFELLEPMHNDV